MDLSIGLDYVRNNHQAVLHTFRRDGRPQLSPVTVAVDDTDHVIISCRETAMKVHNLRRDDRASLCVFPDKWLGRWVQLEGRAQIQSLPEALDGLVAYYRGLRGEHPDWDEYRAAMIQDRRLLIRIHLDRVGPDRQG